MASKYIPLEDRTAQIWRTNSENQVAERSTEDYPTIPDKAYEPTQILKTVRIETGFQAQGGMAA